MLLPRRAPAAPDPRLLAFTAELLDRGFVAELVRHSCCGEDDVRLHVREAVTPVTVELLLPGAYRPAQCWDAVRVDGDQRAVWRGPHLGAGPEPLVGFIGDLLRAESPEALGDRYQLLG